MGSHALVGWVVERLGQRGRRRTGALRDRLGDSGSILTPSAFCGITGLRPTYGLVSRHGAMALSWTMDKIGPMCHSAEDCGLVLQAIAGGDSNDPGSAGKSFYYAPQFARKMEDIRVGYAPVDFAEWADPSARPAFDKALADVRALGVKMVEVKLPDFPYRRSDRHDHQRRSARLFSSR